jgi:hypothetical protein
MFSLSHTLTIVYDIPVPFSDILKVSNGIQGGIRIPRG